MKFYIMPRPMYPNGLLAEQYYGGNPELSDYLEMLHVKPDLFNPAWIHANYRQGSSCCPCIVMISE